MTHASSLRDALRLLNARSFDAVLLDLFLPDALELAALAPIVRGAPDTPVVVLTSYDDEILAARAMRYGAHDYVVKDQLVYRTLPRIVRLAVTRAGVQRRLFEARAGLSVATLGASLSHDLNNALARGLYAAYEPLEAYDEACRVPPEDCPPWLRDAHNRYHRKRLAPSEGDDPSWAPPAAAAERAREPASSSGD